jgi:uncharacterized membrane protein YfcA
VIVGAVADPPSAWTTSSLVGAFAGGLLGWLVGLAGPDPQTAGLLGSFVGAISGVLVHRARARTRLRLRTRVR